MGKTVNTNSDIQREYRIKIGDAERLIEELTKINHPKIVDYNDRYSLFLDRVNTSRAHNLSLVALMSFVKELKMELDKRLQALEQEKLEKEKIIKERREYITKKIADCKEIITKKISESKLDSKSKDNMAKEYIDELQKLVESLFIDRESFKDEIDSPVKKLIDALEINICKSRINELKRALAIDVLPELEEKSDNDSLSKLKTIVEKLEAKAEADTLAARAQKRAPDLYEQPETPPVVMHVKKSTGFFGSIMSLFGGSKPAPEKSRELSDFTHRV